MTKDFMEVLGARGFGVRGTFKTYKDMIHPDKKGSDLILTAEILFTPDTSGTQLDTYIKGSVKVNCEVTLVVSESLTNERMWTKSIKIDPIKIFFLHHIMAMNDHI